ncbi:MAG: outer membrane protein assembly factor BamE [Alphaproteobacteria bacterium]|jgi:outer membrane protein assembly factor BamE (lipoprotein component of BamABCDE complex)|uniref:outer membrane protein assembly factor BamE n=1 Tax=Maricaulis alexandrii TaxID=2570354 RepID=UPI00110837E4|nr:outer membrane protein assembly factor BamE [Maricaulis alexandrii]MCR9267502.1 outer membrane protein assembly factor BamE [Alphaproteobacteria bacterium]
MKRRLSVSLLVLACALGASACNPVLRSHGYRYAIQEEPNITPDEDTIDTVRARLGNPSTTGTFEDNTWYYISSTRESLAYLRPVTRDRRIIAVSFDDTGVVEQVAEYSLDDGRLVAYAGRETPTRGRELTFIEQILGNVGRLPTEQFGGEQNLPGGAGGPRRDQ